MKVKLYLFIHPQWHLVLGYNKDIAPSYILSQIELEAKEYGIKNSIANIMNQLNCTLDVTNELEYNNQGRALLLIVSKQNLKPSSWRI
jgi:subtilase family serine protease